MGVLLPPLEGMGDWPAFAVPGMGILPVLGTPIGAFPGDCPAYWAAEGVPDDEVGVVPLDNCPADTVPGAAALAGLRDPKDDFPVYCLGDGVPAGGILFCVCDNCPVDTLPEVSVLPVAVAPAGD